MIDRRLVLCHEGAPVAWGLFPGDIRRRICLFPDDHAELLQVWTVPSYEAGAAMGEEITARFALEWSKEFDFGGGIEPAEYLGPFPRFVREHAGAQLIAAWHEAVAQRAPIGSAA